MYDITLALSVMVAIHLAFIVIGMYVLKLDYNAFLGMMVGAGLVSSIVAKFFAASWKTKFEAAIKQEKQSGELLRDAFYGVVIMFGGAAVSATLLYRRYGIGGWLGLLGANAVVNAVV
jgi:hypothetical protein